MTTKNRYAFFNGEIVPIGEAKVSIMTSALNYGTAVFEGICANWNEEAGELYVFRLLEHMERFIRNARLLMIELPYSAGTLCEATLDLLRREEFRTDTYIRPLAYKAGEAIGVRLHGIEPGCSIFAVPFGPYIDVTEGARLAVSSWRRIDDNAIPARGKITGAYVNSALAKTEAVQNGFDDAIMLAADGHVSEASAANVFIVQGGRLVTPPTTHDILPGITRQTVFDLAAELKIAVDERPVDRSELYQADEVFLCGTGVHVVPVIEIDRRPIGDSKAGAITGQLSERFFAAARGAEPRYREWCTPVYGK